MATEGQFCTQLIAPEEKVRTFPRTRKGCLTCRSYKVKCDENKPICSRCTRLDRLCKWYGEEVSTDAPINSRVVSPNLDQTTSVHFQYFAEVCCRFLLYSNDSKKNPFQTELVPLANKSTALFYAMCAVAAGHLARRQEKYALIAQVHYGMALKDLHAELSDPVAAYSEAVLGTSLLLCVYAISYLKDSSWYEQLKGARDLILFQGGLKPNYYLTRFFFVLDISGSLATSKDPLLKENYLPRNDARDEYRNKRGNASPNWPVYDSQGFIATHFHSLMAYMAQISCLSSQSMAKHPDREFIRCKAQQIHSHLVEWWQNCPPAARDQSNGWRSQVRPRKLSVSETLEEEIFCSTKSCMYGCVIYLNHILNPLGYEPRKPEVDTAIREILEIALNVPEGFGLEMGHYWGLFMVGISLFQEDEIKSLIKQKLKIDSNGSIYHGDRSLEFLEFLWSKQHRHGQRYDWRQVQAETGIQLFILV